MYTYMIPCLLGLEKPVGDEVKRLGLADVQVENGRVLSGCLRPPQHQSPLRCPRDAGTQDLYRPQL